MNRYEKTVARVIAGCGRPSGRSRIRALADAALSAPMFNYESEGDNPTDTGREEPQDDRPPLLHYDLGTSTVFYQADEIDSDRTISATATVDVEAVR